MGLDMYLKAEKHISSWQYDKDADQGKLFTKILAAAGVPNGFIDENSPTGTISFNVGYWRKANAIHSWFVGECQGGEDDCQTVSVDKETLVKLKGLCVEVLADPDKAEQILAPKGGFFFASTEIDDWYMDDLKHTVEICNKCEVLGEKGWTFTYRASW